MIEFLLNHALENVWCSPKQDGKAIVKPARLSPAGGALRTQKVMWEDISLPTTTDAYHVFQVGNIHPDLLNLAGVNSGWKRLSDIINDTMLMAGVYFDTGVMLPRHDTWFHYDHHGNLLMALKEQVRIPGLSTNAPYLYVYKNAYFSSSRYDALSDKTAVQYAVAVDLNSILAMQGAYNTAASEGGAAFAYVNGWLVDNFVPSRIETGDVMEFVHDTSIYRIVEFNVSDLDAFTSTLDAKQKYLLNYPTDAQNTTIDFQDDIELHLIKSTDTGGYNGVYYHRHMSDSVRMLTHKDYSIPVSYVQGYQTDHSSVWTSINEMKIRMYIRKSGFQRPLIQDANRIFELYRLPADDVYSAMIGVDATVTEWQADTLERSAYTEVMRTRTMALDEVKVQKAYGYNSISKLIGETPQAIVVEGTDAVAYLPSAYYSEATVYEYDVDGLLLGYYIHDTGGSRYVCRNASAQYVEAVAGMADTALDVVFGDSSSPVVATDSKYNYRAYISTTYDDNGTLVYNWNWSDVSNSELITVANNQITFNSLAEDDYTAVLSDKKFLGYSFTRGEIGGIIEFSILVTETHGGTTQSKVSTIPPRRLDLWMNGKALIEGLDYYLQWPKVVVTNKTHRVVGDQSFVVRATGFCNSDMTLDNQREFGFVVHGYLSSDQSYDIRDDKVLSIFAGGQLKMRDDLEFAEHNTGVSVTNLSNGTPYSIRENIIPIRGGSYIDTYSMRTLALETDQRISDYMSLKYPEPTIDGLSAIEELYAVVSPFISKIIDDLQQGIISDTPLQSHYSNADIESWLADYTYLLEYDPAYVGYDENYVIVYPIADDTPTQLNTYQYLFVKRVVDLYLGGKVPLSQFIEVTLPQA